MLDLILSTIAFFAVSFWLRRYLDNQGIAPGMTRGVLVLVAATVASFAVSALVSQFDHEPSFDKQTVQTLTRLVQ
ncbi:MAG: hypothetical protein ACYCSS_11635 [Sulfuriferula sp.]